MVKDVNKYPTLLKTVTMTTEEHLMQILGVEKEDPALCAWILVEWSKNHFSVMALGAMDISREVQSWPWPQDLGTEKYS